MDIDNKQWQYEAIPHSEALALVTNPLVIEAAKQIGQMLCEKYPFVSLTGEREGNSGVINAAWRAHAIEYFEHGHITSGLWYLDGTGIPQEELESMANLLALSV